MRKIYGSAEEVIGRTPLVRLRGIEEHLGLSARLFAKIEKGNITGSVKDRPALFMLNDFERRGLIAEGGKIVEATSGNMGISLSALASRRGYGAVIVMPKSASPERQKIIRALGAELVLTDGGMAEAVIEAENICRNEKGAVRLSQFDNPMNVLAHEMTTGPEIYRDTEGDVDIFVAGVGTGGTLSGVGRYLKGLLPSVKVVAVEPRESAVLSGGKPSSHRILGIGAGFLPTILDKNVINEVITVDYEQAREGSELLARREGILSGISSGAAISAVLSLAARKENEGKNIVTLLPDGIEKYLTT